MCKRNKTADWSRKGGIHGKMGTAKRKFKSATEEDGKDTHMASGIVWI